MINAFRLAGFFAAHAIWCVSDEEGLIPMLAYTNENGEREMKRIVSEEDAEKAVANGKQMLDTNPHDANDAVLLYDARIPLNGEKFDAIITEIRCYFSPLSRAVMAIPYKPATSGDFRVYKPKLLQWEGCEDFNLDAVVKSFFEGVDSHEKGAAVWNLALDQSI